MQGSSEEQGMCRAVWRCYANAQRSQQRSRGEHPGHNRCRPARCLHPACALQRACLAGQRGAVEVADHAFLSLDLLHQGGVQQHQ